MEGQMIQRCVKFGEHDHTTAIYWFIVILQESIRRYSILERMFTRNASGI